MILRPRLVISWAYHLNIWLKIFILTCYTSAIYQKLSILAFFGGKMDMKPTILSITSTNEPSFKSSVNFWWKIITMTCVSTENHLKCSNLGWLRRLRLTKNQIIQNKQQKSITYMYTHNHIVDLCVHNDYQFFENDNHHKWQHIHTTKIIS